MPQAIIKQERLRYFEHTFQQDSANFYRAFERGETGDEMEFIKWAGECSKSLKPHWR